MCADHLTATMDPVFIKVDFQGPGGGGQVFYFDDPNSNPGVMSKTNFRITLGMLKENNLIA